MNIALIAQDISPSEAFELLAQELANRGHFPMAYLGKGKVFPADVCKVREAVKESDIVVVGMSSSAKLAAPEITACEAAILNNKLFGFYLDTYQVHQRAAAGSWFGPYNQLADFFFAINEREVKSARNIFTDVLPEFSVASGNPIWEGYCFPKFTRKEIRAQWGVADDEILVFAPGMKTPVISTIIWGLLIDALTALPKSKLLISHHPGDRTPSAVDLDLAKKLIIEKLDMLSITNIDGVASVSLTKVQNIISDLLSNVSVNLRIYDDLKKFSSVPVEFLPNGVKTSDVLPGADIVVEWSTSIAIEAAHQRIPVISVSTEIGRKRMLSTSGTENWEPIELGISEEALCCSMDLYDKICMLTENKCVRDNLLKRQAEVYPKPPKNGEAVKKMADTLENLIKINP